MRLICKIAVACLALMLAGAFGGVARAQDLNSGYDFFGNFRNVYSGKCLDVRAEDGYFNSGARVQQYHCTGADEQMWAGHFIFSWVANGVHYEAVQFKVKRSGMCLQPNAFLFNTFDDGLDLVQKPCDESEQLQLWYHEPTSRTAHPWVNYRTAKCIDVAEISTADHARVEQYTCNETGAQVLHTKVDVSSP